MTTRLLLAALIAVTTIAAANSQEQATEKPYPFTSWELFNRAKKLVLPNTGQTLGPDFLKREWDFSAPDKGNFTSFVNIEGLTVTGEKALKFTLTDKTAILGWGNYAGKQPYEQRVNLFAASFLKFEIRQNGADTTSWKLRCYGSDKHGKPRYQKPKAIHLERYGAKDTAEPKGNEWQVIDFMHYANRRMGALNAFALEIDGPRGATIEIRKMRITRDYYQGCFRKEFDIPEGYIWNAVATVGKTVTLYVNGRKVESRLSVQPRPFIRQGSWDMEHTEAVDLAPYLQPGKNCIGMSLATADVPYMVLRGTITMVSGETVTVDSDASWSWVERPGAGWSEPGFDASAWKQVGTDASDPANAFARDDTRSHLKRKTDRPAYDGFMLIENPDDNQLFYVDARPVTFRVRAPYGLEKRAPVLSWHVTKYAGGQETQVAAGTEEDVTYRGRSLRYDIEPGRLSHGVYILHMSLISGEDVLEERIPEPFVVVGRLSTGNIAGTSAKEGLKLTLETTVDFTKPDDTTCEWAEADGADRPDWNYTADVENPVTDPIVVERNGLKYRETRPTYGAQFSYLVRFKHPGDFYLMVVEYPNDRERWMGFSCTSSMDIDPDKRRTDVQKAGPGVRTGNKYPVTGEMQDFKWIYRSDAGLHAVNVQTLQNLTPAAAARLRIYHIANPLPGLKVADHGERWIGYLTERVAPPSSWAQAFKSRRTQLTDTKGRFCEKDGRPVLEMCALLEEWLDTCMHYVEYLRFTGQNFHALACFQYSDSNTPYLPMPETQSLRIDHSLHSIAARVLSANGIDFVASVEFVYSQSLLTMINESVGDRDRFYLMDKTGQAVTAWGGRYGMNFNHPEVRALMLRVADQIAEKFHRLPGFKGINWTAYFGGEWMPAYRTSYGDCRNDPMGIGYGDTTISRFENDTGITLPDMPRDSMERFSLRYQFLNSDAIRERWLQWRCEAMKGFFSDVAATARKHRQDLFAIANLYFTPQHARWHKESGLSLRDFMRQGGWDARLFDEDESVWLTHWMDTNLRYEPIDKKSGYPIGWDIHVKPEYFDVFKAQDTRVVMVLHHWLEMETFAGLLPYRDKWPRPGQATIEVQADGYNANEVYAQALIGADPSLVMFGFSDAGYLLGQAQERREFAQVLRSLPKEKFSPVGNTGLKTNFAIRELRKDGKLYFYVVNPGYWPVQGTVDVKGAERVLNLALGTVAATAKGGAVRVPVKLHPFGAAAFVADSREADIANWETETPAPADLAHMKNMIAHAARLSANPVAQAALTPEDRVYMKKALGSAEADIKAKQYARAWATVTDSRFWILVYEYMEQALAMDKYATENTPQPAVQGLRDTAVLHVGAPPVIDGKLDDPVWSEARPATGFIQKDGYPAKVGTRVCVACDKESLYFAFTCKDNFPEDVRATSTVERQIWSSKDDVAVIFLQPDPTKPTYYQMAFTAGGLKFDQSAIAGNTDYDFSPQWEVATATTKEGWVAEIRIPASELKGKIQKGQKWGANFCRVFRLNKVFPSTWTHMPDHWHDPDHFGRLQF